MDERERGSQPPVIILDHFSFPLTFVSFVDRGSFPTPIGGLEVGIWRELSRVISPTFWIFWGNHDGNNRVGLSGAIWGFGVNYLGLFGDLTWSI